MAKKIARTIAEAKKMGVDTFTGKDGKKKAAVTREELAAWEKKSGKKGLRAFLNTRNAERKASTSKPKLAEAKVTAKRKLTPAKVTAKRKLTPAKVTASYRRTKPKPNAEPLVGPRVSKKSGNNNKKVYRGTKRTPAEIEAKKKKPTAKQRAVNANSKKTLAQLKASSFPEPQPKPKKPKKPTGRRKPTPITRRV